MLNPQEEIDLSFRQRVKRILREIQASQSYVLDCGCGDGYLLSRTTGASGALVGVDVSLESLKAGLKENQNLNLVCASVLNLPFRNRMFDSVVLMEVLEHLADPKHALNEVSRVMKESAMLNLTVPNLGFPLVWDPINKLLTDYLHVSPIRNGILAGFWYMHYRLYTPFELKKQLNGAFSVILLEGLTHMFVPMNPLLLNIYVTISRHVTHRYFRLPMVFLMLLNRMDKYNDSHHEVKGATTLFAQAKPRFELGISGINDPTGAR
jgi:SAM-dependent methyltransferase